MRTISDPNVLFPLLRQHGGHSLAYSALQPGLDYFGDPDLGFIAYRPCLGHAVVLGDPCCAEAHMDVLLGAFLKTHRHAIFMQIHGAAAERLEDHGLCILPVGVENEIDPRTFSLEGRRKQDLRHYRNKARAAGVLVRESADSPALRAELQPLSDAWLREKSRIGRELRFLARPYAVRPEPGVRVFVARRGENALGFVLMDPMYRGGIPHGYTAVLLRQCSGAPEGTLDYINLHAIEQFRRENLAVFSLGVSPFHRLPELARTHGAAPWPAYLLCRALLRWGNPIYHFHGLTFHKRRYRAGEIPVFAALPGPCGLLPLYAAALASRML